MINAAAGDYNLYRYCHNDPINKTDPMGLWWDISRVEAKDFNGARERMSKDPEMKKIFDAIAADKEHRVSVIAVSGKNQTDGTINKQGARNANIYWNPRGGLRTTDGRGGQSPAMGLGHEAAHAERYLRDHKGYERDTAPLPGAHNPYVNREEQRVITGIERHAALNPAIHESVRYDGGGTLKIVPSVDSVP